MLTNINVTNLTLAQVITISFSFSTTSIIKAGDLNGDNYEDFFINTGTGTTFLIWGKKDLGNIDLDNFTSSDGITITSMYLSACIGIGDIDGDGIDDFLCNAPLAGNLYEGITYLIFGKSTGWSNVNLDNFSTAYGITITGASYYDQSGYWINPLGDINNDGCYDFSVGFAESQTIYFMFGGPNLQNTNLGNLDASQGIQVSAASDITDCADIGDIDGDGIDDVLCNTYYKSSTYTGKSSIIFGHETWSNIDLASCGFPLCVTIEDTNHYDRDSWVISGAGDVRRSGFSDFLVSVNSSLTYRVNGKGSAWSDMNLINFNSAEGSSITSPAYYGFSGGPLAPLGDINKDGYDDYAMGAALTDRTTSGILYVFLGNKTINNIKLEYFDSSNGITIQGIYDTISVAGLGDVNGDGYADIGLSDTHDAWVIWGGEVDSAIPTSKPTNKPTSRPIHPTKLTTTTTMSPTPEGYTYPPTTEEHHHSSDSLTSESWFVPTVATISSVVGVVCLAGLGWYAWNHYHKNTDQPFELIEN